MRLLYRLPSQYRKDSPWILWEQTDPYREQTDWRALSEQQKHLTKACSTGKYYNDLIKLIFKVWDNSSSKITLLQTPYNIQWEDPHFSLHQDFTFEATIPIAHTSSAHTEEQFQTSRTILHPVKWDSSKRRALWQHSV